VQEFLKKPIFRDSKHGVENFREFISPYLAFFPSIKLTEKNFESVHPEIYVELFTSKVISSLSDDKMYWILKGLSKDEARARFLDEFTFENAVSHLARHKSLLHLQQKRVIDEIESEIRHLDFVCF